MLWVLVLTLCGTVIHCKYADIFYNALLFCVFEYGVCVFSSSVPCSFGNSKLKTKYFILCTVTVVSFTSFYTRFPAVYLTWWVFILLPFRILDLHFAWLYNFAIWHCTISYTAFHYLTLLYIPSVLYRFVLSCFFLGLVLYCTILYCLCIG